MPEQKEQVLNPETNIICIDALEIPSKASILFHPVPGYGSA